MAEGKELNWFTELPSFYCSRGLKQYYQVLLKNFNDCGAAFCLYRKKKII